MGREGMNEITNFSKIGLAKIKDVQLLSNEDFSIMKTLNKEMQRVTEVRQVHRTETEMRYSVLTDMKYPTLASKYWQAIREQHVFNTNLIYLACDYEIEQGNLELLECDLAEITGDKKRDKANKKIKRAEIKKKEFTLMQMYIEAHDRVRELRIWEKIKNEIRKKDSKFSITDVNAHQMVSWRQRWENELKIGKMSGNQSMTKNAAAQLGTIKKEKKQGQKQLS